VTPRVQTLPPVLAVAGMAFEARIARGPGVEAVYAARADLLEHALSDALARGASGIISFGTAGGLAPGLEPGTLIIADAIEGPLGRASTDTAWSARLAAALGAAQLAVPVHRGVLAAVAKPVVSVEAKRSLHQATGGLAVDMESHIAAAMAAARGLPFAACRVVVDPAWRALPPAAMVGLQDDGTTAVGPVLRALLRSPRQIGALIQVARDAQAARATLVRARRAMSGAFLFED